tara:strand:+ start:1383 stop:1913 length:531 start_codon:yes stop_codon:yes gene_type:complete
MIPSFINGITYRALVWVSCVLTGWAHTIGRRAVIEQKSLQEPVVADVVADPSDYLTLEHLDPNTARIAARLSDAKREKLQRGIDEIMENHSPEEGAPLVGKLVTSFVMKDCCDWLVDHLELCPPGTRITVKDALKMYYRAMLGKEVGVGGDPHLTGDISLRESAKAPHLRVLDGGE